MSFLDKLRAQRQLFLDAIDANKGDINLDIFEDFYPDKAHFVFELIQNAEDARATNCRFSLLRDRCIFEHDGSKQFEEKDIEAITGINRSSKSESPDQIGKFGVGFKSVFIYSHKPRVYSKMHSFCITELVMPEKIPADKTLGEKTKFELLFDNPDKPQRDAFNEIKEGLDNLSASTLLFLNNIKNISWSIDSSADKGISKEFHSDNHIETLKKIDMKTTESSHFLCFKRPIEGLESQNVALAFELDRLPKVQKFEPGTSLRKQFRISAAKPGRVAVFFTAEKESSGLRFHLHAPFVPELSRASVKDTPVNTPLFEQLAMLASDSLFAIRDLGLLSATFLGVLPNPKDEIPSRYQVIRTSIITAMNEEALTPTHGSKNHKPAKHLLQAKAALKSLLNSDDIERLVDYEEVQPAWAIAAQQKNSEVDRFLSGLDITEWDVEEFLEVLEDRLSSEEKYNEGFDEWYSDPDPIYLRWLGSKTDEWHQKLYALLYRELEPRYELDRLEDLSIIRISTGEYKQANECYFPTKDTEKDALLPRVSKGIYTAGKSKKEQNDAHSMLEEIGVREVGEREQIEVILKQRYSPEANIPSRDIHENDLSRFMAFIDEHKYPKDINLFQDSRIFEGVDGEWHRSSKIYLDTPYFDTGLHAYKNAIGNEFDHVPLSDNYLSFQIDTRKLYGFARELGAQTNLLVEKQSTNKHLMKESLHQDYWKRWTNTSINVDWMIPHLQCILDKPSEDLSKLIWQTMMNERESVLFAKFRPNQQYPTRIESSSLVLMLESTPWIPQKNDQFVQPAKASQDLLPDGYPLDLGWPWIKAIRFGEESEKRVREIQRKREVAKEIGFENLEALSEAKRFAELPQNERRRILKSFEKSQTLELPTQQPSNAERRAARVSEQAVDAPDRSTEKRMRSVSFGREAVKKDAAPYLRHQYTNDDGMMICQVCKGALPFQLADKSYYFETVEFLPELGKRHYQNYLSLCPNHSAMFKHANGTADMLKELFIDFTENELEVILADKNQTLYFTKTHITDIKAIIDADSKEPR